jgi:spore coat polysaccharide biosynthesis protein SpsF
MDYLDNNYDYVSNFIPRVTYPTGIGVQVFSTKLLNEVDKLTNDSNDPEYIKNRENVTWYIYHHLEKYKIGTVEAEGILRYPKIRLDLDQPEDYELITNIYQHFDNFKVSLEDVIKYLMENPELITINQKYLTGDEKYV